MNDYLNDFRDFLQHIRDAEADTLQQKRRMILANFLRRTSLEFSGQADLVFSPALTSPEIRYNVSFGNKTTSYIGGEAVRAYFDKTHQGSTAAIAIDQHLAVADWGLTSHSVDVRFVTGAQLADEGRNISPSNDIFYAEHTPMVLVWYYDDNGALREENNMLSSSTLKKIEPEAVPTPYDIAAVARSFL
ncbi:hypothetical protein ACQPZ2_29745 [Nocardia pseudovaccinii]|uniref:hypothetical protein n=1 Tax=Nocardia pseudovaccinii TaxID=189540 RepID=UPI003D906185